MAESRSGGALALETPQHGGIVDQLFGDDFERYETREGGILRFENDAHGPTSNLLENAVLGDHRSDHGFSMIAEDPGDADTWGRAVLFGLVVAATQIWFLLAIIANPDRMVPIEDPRM